MLFVGILGRTKVGKKMSFHWQVHSISPEQSPAEKERGLHMEMGKKKKKKVEEKTLSKPGRCHGFSEVCENSCWGQSLPLLKGSVLSLGGAGSEFLETGQAEASMCWGAHSSCISTARAAVQAGSRSGPRTQLCFLG